MYKMIVYNNRYRGPLEYEKFLLNILSLNNMVNILENYEISGTEEEVENIVSIYNEINALFNLYLGDNSISDRIYNNIIKENGL